MGVKEMNHDVSMLAWFKLLFGSVPTVNMIVTHDGSSSKKKKSSDASPKPGDDGYSSSDEFMPDKHGNLPWKKKSGKSVASTSGKKKSKSKKHVSENSDDDFM